VLTISGPGVRGNRGPLDPVADLLLKNHGLAFDSAWTTGAGALERLPTVEITPHIEYDGQPHRLRGPLLATVLQAEKLVLLTNTPGVLDKAGSLLTDLTAREIDALFADGTISGGMLPKISGALDAAKAGVNAVHIIDGRVPHAMLLEILTDQAYGTMIRSH